MQHYELVNNRIRNFTLLSSILLMSLSCQSLNINQNTKGDLTSREYVLQMGHGWNLGNSFDSVDPNLQSTDLGERSWGNPIVTKELIQSIKDKGFKSIRIPLTLYKRYEIIDGKVVIKQDWLNRYQEVVDWALDAELYVMINIHHDSWLWINKWNGNIEDQDYKTYLDLWSILAERFKNHPLKLSFETINEPQFEETKGISNQEKLDLLNLGVYNTIRGISGLNKTRKIIIPTMHTNHEKKHSDPTLNWILNLNDPNIIVTVHYYSDWVFSTNLGRTGFDEILWDNHTARKGANDFFDILEKTFSNNNLGVVIGEFGLLGYDKGLNILQEGEEFKYYEYIYSLANKFKMSLMFWDNGSGVNRNILEHNWKNQLLGNVLESALSGNRHSYSTNLDTIYLGEKIDEDLKIPLTLNGNSFTKIEMLKENKDYKFDENSSVLTISKEYINKKLDSDIGLVDRLEIVFSGGVNWFEKIVKIDKPILSPARGNNSSGLIIKTDFNGTELRRVSAYSNGKKVGPNSSWWSHLENGSSFNVDYNFNTITILPLFFKDSSLSTEDIKFVFEFYDGQIAEYTIKNRNGVWENK